MLQDDSGSRGETNMWCRASDWPAAQSGAEQLIGYLHTLSGAVPIRYELIFSAKQDPPVTPPDFGRCDRGALIIFSCDTPDTYQTLIVPAITDAVLLTEGPGAGLLLNPDAPDVLALVAGLVDALWCNPFGNIPAEMETAYVQLKAS